NCHFLQHEASAHQTHGHSSLIAKQTKCTSPLSHRALKKNESAMAMRGKPRWIASLAGQGSFAPGRGSNRRQDGHDSQMKSTRLAASPFLIRGRVCAEVGLHVVLP